MIEKSLLLRESPSATSSPDPEATSKAYPSADFLPKTIIQRWNQADLDYFDLHFDKVYRENEIIPVRKDMYYRNVVLFIQRFQCLVTFRSTAFVKANITISFRGSALECYTFELSNFDCDALNNDPSMKSWVNTLSHCFKVHTSMALDLLTNETYSLNKAWAQ